MALSALSMTACASVGTEHSDNLDGTRWRVAAVNGQETPTSGDYSIAFDAPRISARFGCNGMGGDYSRTGDLLAVRNLSQTLMGCPQPAATFESRGAAILNAPMQIGRHPTTGGLTLSNANGRIDLVLIVTGRRL